MGGASGVGGEWTALREAGAAIGTPRPHGARVAPLGARRRARSDGDEHRRERARVRGAGDGERVGVFVAEGVGVAFARVREHVLQREEVAVLLTPGERDLDEVGVGRIAVLGIAQPPPTCSKCSRTASTRADGAQRALPAASQALVQSRSSTMATPPRMPAAPSTLCRMTEKPSVVEESCPSSHVSCREAQPMCWPRR